MQYSLNSVIEEYTLKKKKGMEFSKIRKELLEKNIDEDDVSYIIRCIDDNILNEELAGSGRRRMNEMKLIGFFLLTGGLCITLLTYTGIIDLKGHFILMYGPVIGGFLLIRASGNVKKQNKPAGKRHI